MAIIDAQVHVWRTPRPDNGRWSAQWKRPSFLAEELIAYCRQHLADIKCPRSIDFEAELPRHPTGKLYKRLLRDRYWQGKASRIV